MITVLIIPAALGLLLGLMFVGWSLPRQRRRDDLSGREKGGPL